MPYLTGFFIGAFIIPFIWRSVSNLVKFLMKRGWRDVPRRDWYYSGGALLTCLLVHIGLPPAQSHIIKKDPPSSLLKRIEKSTRQTANPAFLRLIHQRENIDLPVQVARGWPADKIAEFFGLAKSTIRAAQTLKCDLIFRLKRKPPSKDYRCILHQPIPLIRRHRFPGCGQKRNESCVEDFYFNVLTFVFTEKGIDILKPALQGKSGNHIIAPQSFRFQLAWNDESGTQIKHVLPISVPLKTSALWKEQSPKLLVTTSEGFKHADVYGHKTPIIDRSLFLGCCDEKYAPGRTHVARAEVSYDDAKTLMSLLPKFVSGLNFKTDLPEKRLLKVYFANRVATIASLAKSKECHDLILSDDMSGLAATLDARIPTQIRETILQRKEKGELAENGSKTKYCKGLKAIAAVMANEVKRVGLTGAGATATK